MAHAQTASEAHRSWERGKSCAARGQWAEAERAFRQAVRLQPKQVVYLLNLARAQLGQGRHADTLETVQQALRIEPDHEVAQALAVHCLMELKRPLEAAELMQRAPERVRADAAFHFQLGRALEAAGRPREAIQAYMEALARKIDLAPAHAHLGYCFNVVDMKEEAAQCFRTALTLGCGEHDLNLLGLLAYREREVCRWVDGAQDARALCDAIEALGEEEDRPLAAFSNLALFDDPALHLRAAQVTARYAARGVAPLESPSMPDVQGRRLRIGYVSSDFFHHATTLLFAGSLEAHDRTRFEVTLYSHSRDDGSELAQRVRQGCERFVDISDLRADEAARRIRADGIDILVDLKGYTKESRPEIFAYRAAPVQVSFLGYPGTTGAPWMDYVIGDPVVTPLEDAPFYTEKIAQMPLCYQPNDSQRALPPPMTREQAGLPEDAVVLCAFNQPYKISPEVFDAWCEVMHRVPRSVLWLLEWNEQVRKNLIGHAQARGIEPERLVWAPLLRYEQHIARLQNADVFLDTWPYNAHTTASDALWAGVPVVTKKGRSFASRVAASLNCAVGLQELVADDPAGFVERAVALARDLERRRSLRDALAGARQGRLFDSSRFARDIERLYEAMADRSVRGLAPDHLPAVA